MITINLKNIEYAPITEAEIIHIKKEKRQDEIDRQWERMGCPDYYALRQEGIE
jgi:hypothetical protein